MREKADRLLEHCLAQFIVERRKAVSVHAVMFLESAHIEPIACKFNGEVPHARIIQKPAGLSNDDFRVMQIASDSLREQLFIRHAGPEEIAEPAGERVIGQW